MNENRYSMKAMAQATGVTAHTLRYYERIGLLPPIPRAPSGHRVFAQGHVEWVTFIKRLRATGMPIQRILQYANLMKMGNATIPDRLEVLLEHREAIRHQLCEVKENLERIEHKIGLYQEFMEEREKNLK